MTAILRPLQVTLLDQIDQAIQSGCRRIMVQAPTGYGKTVIAGTIAGNILDAGKRAIFTVPALSLIDQTVEQVLFAEGVRDVGVIQAQHPLTNYSRAHPGRQRADAAAPEDPACRPGDASTRRIVGSTSTASG